MRKGAKNYEETRERMLYYNMNVQRSATSSILVGVAGVDGTGRRWGREREEHFSPAATKKAVSPAFFFFFYPF